MEYPSLLTLEPATTDFFAVGNFPFEMDADFDLFTNDLELDPLEATQQAIAATSAQIAQYKMPSSLSSTSAASTSVMTTVAALNDPRIACNNKTLLDARWSLELLQMTTVQLNRHLRFNPMSDEDTKALKSARRRHKSRQYSDTLRRKRRERRAGANTEAASNQSDEDAADMRLAELEADNVALRAQCTDLEARLGGMNMLFQKVVASLQARGINVDELSTQ